MRVGQAKVSCAFAQASLYSSYPWFSCCEHHMRRRWSADVVACTSFNLSLQLCTSLVLYAEYCCSIWGHDSLLNSSNAFDKDAAATMDGEYAAQGRSSRLSCKKKLQTQANSECLSKACIMLHDCTNQKMPAPPGHCVHVHFISRQ